MLMIVPDVCDELFVVCNSHVNFQTEWTLQRTGRGMIFVEMVDGLFLRRANVIADSAFEWQFSRYVNLLHVIAEQRYRWISGL